MPYASNSPFKCILKVLCAAANAGSGSATRIGASESDFFIQTETRPFAFVVCSLFLCVLCSVKFKCGVLRGGHAAGWVGYGAHVLRDEGEL